MPNITVEIDGARYRLEGLPEGTTDAQAYDMAKQAAASGSVAPPPAGPPPPPPESPGVLPMIGRQLGLTARYALEGPADAASVLTEPIRYATDRILGTTGKTKSLGGLASSLADTLGLPKPETPLERVVGTGSKLVAGTIAGGGAARAINGGAAPATTTPAAVPMIGGFGPSLEAAATNLGTATRAIVPTIAAADPIAAATGAAGAGIAGQATKEAGGGPLAQFGASLVGGVAAGMAPGVATSAVNQVRRMLTPSMSPAQVDLTISETLQNQGINYADLSASVKAQLRREVSSALNTGRPLDEGAISRLAAFKAAGMTPTKGMISGDPIQITREQNLAKQAANMGPEAPGGSLPYIYYNNGRAGVNALDQIGTGGSPLAAGQTTVGSIAARHEALSAAEQAAWDRAKGMPGYQHGQLDTTPVHDAFKAVDDLGLLDQLSGPVAKRMQAFMTGEVPFTPMQYKNLRSMISGSLSPTSSGNEKAAAKAAADVLDAAAIRMRTTNPGGIDYGNLPSTGATAARMQAADEAPQAVIDAVDAARAATRAKYAYGEGNPLVETVLGAGRAADPERIAKSYISSGTLADAQRVANEVGEAGAPAIKAAILEELKKKALAGNAPETGNFSGNALGKALREMGNEKLGLFFTQEEITQLHNVARAGALTDFQPRGSAVNNSNSGAMLVGRALDMLDSIGKSTGTGLATKTITIPARLLAKGVSNASLAAEQRAVMNPGAVDLLQAAPQRPGLSQSLALPAIVAPGIFASEPQR